MTKPLKPRDVDRLLEFGATPPPPEGKTERLGRYILHREVGRGAMGVVYEAEDSELKRRVAVKILGEDVHLTDGGRRRFQREAQAAAALSHPNIVTLYDAGEENGRMFLVMEFIQGRPLSEFLQDSKGAYGRFIPILEKTARGVGAVHEKGLVHRDLKPGNIFVTGAGDPKVGDFGLAHWVQPDMAMTKPGTAIGTPLYMAPEQVRGDLDDITSRTDVYALGAILYEILTGDPPHIGNTLPEIYSRISSNDPVPPRRINKRVPPDLEAICLKALEKEPERRYPTASAFADDLKRHLDGLPVLARRAGPFRSLTNRVRRQPLVWTLALLTTVAIVALGVALSNRVPPPIGQPGDLADARMAMELQSAFAELQKTTSAMEDLENFFHGAKPRETIESRLTEIERTTRAVELKFPRAGSPQAWLGLAEFFARRGGALERIRRACAAAPEDPIPPTLLARACLFSFGEGIPAPWFSVKDNYTMPPEPLKETEAMKACRDEARLSITRAIGLKMSRHLRQAQDFLPATEAMALMAAAKNWDAAAALEKVAQDPSLRAGVGWIKGLALRFDNHTAEALEAWEGAAARGWPKAMLATAIGYLKRVYEDRRSPENARLFARGFETLDRLIDLDPSNSEAYRYRAYIRYDQSASANPPLTDPTEEFRRVGRDIDEYLRLHPDPAVALDEHAYMMFLLGRGSMNYRADPVPWLEKAIADLQKLITLRSETPDSLFMLGLYNLQKGQAESINQRNPIASFDASIDGYSRFLKTGLSSAALSNRANAYSGKAEWLMAHEGDPLPDYQLALADYAKTIAIEKINGPGHDNRGQVYQKLALWQADHGTDPIPFLEKGLADCDKAIQIDPVAGLYKLHRAVMLTIKARMLIRSGGDPLPALAIATTDLSAIILADSAVPAFFYHRADVYQMRAEAEHKAGKVAAADSSMALALADSEKACTPSTDPAFWIQRAQILETVGRVKDAIQAYRKVLEQSPDARGVAERIRYLENR